MSTISAGTTSGTALVSSGDTTGELVFKTNGTTTAMTIGTDQVITVAGAATGGEIRINEALANGTNYVAVKAPNSVASNVTFTLPSADGTNGQFLQTNGSGTLAFATVPATTPAGSTGQIQYNNAGAFGAVSSGTSGQVLLSQGSGQPPTWGAATTTYNKVGDFISTTDQFLFYAAGNSNALTERGWTPGVAKFNSSTFGSSNPNIPSNVNWSNYYNAWYGLITILNPAGAGTQTYIGFSSDGINWWPAGSLPTISAPQGLNQNVLGLDDSNGRFFMSWSNNTSYTAGIVYHTTPGNFDSWTIGPTLVSDTGYSVTPNAFDMQYVNFGTNATSGLVATFFSYSSYRVYVIPAGSTTPTLEATRYTTSGNKSIISWDATNKKCVVCIESQNSTDRVAYVENDVNGTWTTPSTSGIGTNGFENADMGGGYALMVTSTTGYIYSNTYSSWTSASPPAGNIQAVWHNGTYWFMRTSTGVYYTATAIPTGWTRIGTTNWLGTNQTPNRGRRSVARKI